ncbi:MAG: tyrosine-type recombinase/integrase [Anaerovoracaceae bacterium]
MTMTDPIAAHLEDLRQANYSDATLRERARVLATLPHPTELDRETVQTWWASRSVRSDGFPRAAASLSSEASHVREFWKWCRRQGLIDHNPADWLTKVRQSHTKAVVVTEADLDRLIRNAPEDVRRMLALGALAGLRSSEIAALTWEDIDRANGVLWVREGKGKKDRSVPLSGGLLAELGDPSEGPVIGRHATAKAVSAALGRYMRANGVDFTAHKLRARYITRFIAATGDVAAAAEVAGHAGLGSIMRYAVASSDTMRRGAEAAGRIG